MQPQSLNLLICEHSGRWAAALRMALERSAATGRRLPIRIREVRNLAEFVSAIDDNPTVLNLVEAHNGQEALDIIDREQPDAVILDLVMPGMGGFEVLQKLRDQEQTRRLPVIVYTSKVLTGEEKKRLTDAPLV